MKKVSERQDDETVFLTMKIPNREIRSIYNNQISEWFKNRIKEENRKELYEAI